LAVRCHEFVDKDLLCASLFPGEARLLFDVHVESSVELIARPDVVLLDLAATSREAALRALHRELAKEPAVKDGEQLLRDVLERVMVAPVCIAADVALPHARTNAVDRIVLGVARLKDPGVGFDGEHPNIRLMFMIGTPRQQVEEYLKLVAAISRLLRKPGARQALLSAPTEEEFRALLARGAAT
jgi:mannitol/fructose-specific phosphotransferase system IIA component (Ntr-type)